MQKPEAFPLVSVVLATYNGEKFLAEQLDSVLQQSYPNLEIIIVDDGSKDKTPEILRAYASKHPNLQVYFNEENQGYIKNFEKGCGLANGEFISLCDQDDYWHPDKIKRMAALIGYYPMIYCDSFICDENLQKKGNRISDIANLRQIDNCIQVAIFCRMYGHATLFKKSLLSTAIPFLKCIPHDWWLSYLAAVHGGIQYLNEPLVFYRQHSSNTVGVIGGKKKKQSAQIRKQQQKTDINNIKSRIQAFYMTCPDEFHKEKKILLSLMKSYQSFSLINNIKRVAIFYRNRNSLLFVKKHSNLHKYLFCIKMFVKIK